MFTDGFDPFQQRYNTQQNARAFSNPTTPIEWLATREPRTPLAQKIEDFLVEMYNSDVHPTNLPADSLRKIPKDQFKPFLAKLNLLHASICAQIHFAINRIKNPHKCIFVNSKAQVGDIGNVVVFDGLKNHQTPMENLSRVLSMYGSIIVNYRYFIVIEKDLEDQHKGFNVAYFTTFEGKGGPSRGDRASKYVRAVAGQAPVTIQHDDEDLKAEEELIEQQDTGSNIKPQRLQEGLKIPAIRLDTSAKSFNGQAPSYADVRKPKWIAHDEAIRWVGKVDERDYGEVILRLKSGNRAHLLEAHRVYCIKNNLPMRISGLPDWEQPQLSDQTAADDRATSTMQHDLSATQAGSTDSTVAHIDSPQSDNDDPALPFDTPITLSTDPTQDDQVTVPPDNDKQSSPPTTDRPQATSLDYHSPHSPDLSASETPTTPSASTPEPPAADPDTQIGSPLKLSDSQSEDDVAEKLESDGMTSFGNLWQA